MTGIVVGIDVGGTKTHLRAVNREGELLIDARLDSGGWDAEPEPAAAAFLDHLVRRMLPTKNVSALCIGAQGLDDPEVSRRLEKSMHDLGYAAVRCVNDAELLIPAAGISSGIALIAGTGAIGVGRNSRGETLTSGGWGWVLGDDAGATGIVREATRAVLLAHDNGTPDDGLLEALTSSFGVTGAERLARAVNDEPTMANWGPHAPAVFAAAARGSALAKDVVNAAARHLVRLVDQLIARGAVGDHVVAAGSVITHQPLLAETVSLALAREYPRLTFRILDEDPVAGAVSIALRM